MVLNAIPIELASEKTVIQYIAINEDILNIAGGNDSVCITFKGIFGKGLADFIDGGMFCCHNCGLLSATCHFAAENQLVMPKPKFTGTVNDFVICVHAK